MRRLGGADGPARLESRQAAGRRLAFSLRQGRGSGDRHPRAAMRVRASGRLSECLSGNDRLIGESLQQGFSLLVASLGCENRWRALESVVRIQASAH